MKKEHIALLLASYATGPEGGATITSTGEQIKLGLAVAAYPEGEYACEFKSFPYIESEVLHWLRSLDDRVRPYHAFGCWVDDQGRVVLDVVEVLPQDQIALAVLKAKSRGQKAIQLLHPCTTLWLTEPNGQEK